MAKLVDAQVATPMFADVFAPRMCTRIFFYARLNAQSQTDGVHNACVALANPSYSVGDSSGGAVTACRSARGRPGAISRTRIPSGVTSSTARSV